MTLLEASANDLQLASLAHLADTQEYGIKINGIMQTMPKPDPIKI